MSADFDSMSKLTEEMVIQIHDLVIATTGGEFGIRDGATLYFSLDAINREDDVLKKAALALLLAERHPFWDGNKRTAYVLARSLLNDEGYDLNPDEDEVISVMIKITKYKCPEGEELETVLKWLVKNVRSLHDG